MNFTFEIKKEIVSRKMNRDEIKSFVNGILYSNQIGDEKKIKVKLMNAELFEAVLTILKKTNYQFHLEKNSIFINSSQMENIGAKHANLYLAGIFLSSGSISNLDSSSYHLEISFKNENNCNQILDFAKKHVVFNKIKNKNSYVLYIKKNDIIQDFLQIIGAQKSYFSFIDSIIERDFKNQITRIFNLDLHNQNRLVNSNIQFKENYQYIINNKLLHKFSAIQLEFYEFKKNNEFFSLSQLSEELMKQKKIKKTKSCLNHWLIKLKNVREEHENHQNKK